MRSDLYELLRSNAYPGRGILIGCSDDGKRSVLAYFIMGRSENSRNRVFERTGDGIRTEAFDPSKMTDPSRIIYHPVRRLGDITIATNGDQTDTILDHLNQGKDFHAALRTREFEPDAPNYTPRISGLAKPCGSYILSILKSAESDPDRCDRYFFEFAKAPGLGHFISTYQCDGDPLPSFTGEPIPVSLDCSDGLEAFASEIWNALNEDNKVSLYVMSRDLESGEISDHIINKHI